MAWEKTGFDTWINSLIDEISEACTIDAKSKHVADSVKVAPITL